MQHLYVCEKSLQRSESVVIIEIEFNSLEVKLLFNSLCHSLTHSVRHTFSLINKDKHYKIGTLDLHIVKKKISHRGASLLKIACF